MATRLGESLRETQIKTIFFLGDNSINNTNQYFNHSLNTYQ